MEAVVTLGSVKWAKLELVFIEFFSLYGYSCDWLKEKIVQYLKVKIQTAVVLCPKLCYRASVLYYSQCAYET